MFALNSKSNEKSTKIWNVSTFLFEDCKIYADAIIFWKVSNVFMMLILKCKNYLLLVTTLLNATVTT